MNYGESTRAFWVLQYVNGRSFIGRFNGYWTSCGQIDAAALFHSRAEAENALQAFRAEAQERISNKESHAGQFWWDRYGGLVIVAEVEQITRMRPDADPEP